MVRAFRFAVLLVAAAALGACNVKDTKVPPLAGPSELALSLTLQANPDTISQDGSSQSQLVIIARDANGQPAKNVPCRVDISVGGKIADYGTLSARDVTTGSDGRASVTYTAPPASPVASAGSTISLIVTPVSTNFANDTARTVDIRLVPPGIITPPGSAGAFFTATPAAPAETESVTFSVTFCSGTTTTGCTPASATSFSWTFGDGATASGSTVSHSYSAAGTYTVTLTVTDAQGLPSSASLPVSVKPGAAPTAAFDISPTDPALGTLPDGTVGAIVYVNASSSQPAVGRTIVSYNWDFGDGKLKTGVTQDHTYRTANSFTITLKVTDDLGRTATTSKTLVVK